jgi:DHA1 family bicyclomycin/chloramphenicol resistance-like MFS transporter
MNRFVKQKSLIISAIIVMIMIPILAEVLYSPGLPDLARSFAVSTHSAENTLSIYLMGFAFGNLVWGHLSDVVGRRPVVLAGFCVFFFATLLCCVTESFDVFMWARFIQAFGGSASCMGQSINRDLFNQKERIGISASIGTAVSLTPAAGSLLGGYMITYFDWRMTFWFLLVVSAGLGAYLFAVLPETKEGERLRLERRALAKAVSGIWHDSNLLMHGSMIGLGLGLMYVFLGEGAFYCITEMGMSSATYSVICAMGALSYAFGCQLANAMISRGVHYRMVMKSGLLVSAITYLCFLQAVHVGLIVSSLQASADVWFTLASGTVLALWMVGSIGLAMVLTPSFALVLENQKDNAGVAASWFGFINNGLNAAINALMAVLHSQSMWVMPLFFLALCILMMIVFYTSLDKSALPAENIS